jgi:hypothetical protein
MSHNAAWKERNPALTMIHRRVIMSDITNTTDNVEQQDQPVVVDNPNAEGSTPDAPVEETPAPPTVEELLLRDHKERVLGKDKISAAQMASYLNFLGYDPEAETPVNPLEGAFFTEVLGGFNIDMLRRVALKGKSALGEKAKEVDDAYIAMWEEWKDGLSNRPPKSHMWLKGVVAAALLIAEHHGELEQLKVEDVIAKEKAEAEERARIARAEAEKAAAEALAAKEAEEAAAAESDSDEEEEPTEADLNDADTEDGDEDSDDSESVE